MKRAFPAIELSKVLLPTPGLPMKIRFSGFALSERFKKYVDIDYIYSLLRNFVLSIVGVTFLIQFCIPAAAAVLKALLVLFLSPESILFTSHVCSQKFLISFI